jgi:putative transposase
VHQQQRRLARQVSRRTVGSRGHRHAKTKRAALDRRAVNLRRQAIHVLTTRLARRYGTVVVEGLDVAAMQRSMGRRAFRRTVSQAGIGQIRPTLAYKCPALGGRLVLADRWFGSSKSHHDCGGYRADLKLGDRLWSCPRCERLVDRNANAALNLRDWTGAVDTGKADADGDVQRGGVAAPVPHVAAQAGDPRRAGSRRGVGV